MKEFIIIISIIGSSITATAQKIEYFFGKKSDVVDSIKYIIEWYKKNLNEPNIEKLNLYAGFQYTNDSINLFISQYVDADTEMKKLTKKSNRFIPISNTFLLPIIFDSDILSEELSGTRKYIHMGGYFLKIERKDDSFWKVIDMRIVF